MVTSIEAEALPSKITLHSPLNTVNSPLLPKQIGAAVIWNQIGEILIDKRKVGGVMGGLWEFPGGKIEMGETVAECIVREIWEELAIKIAVGEHLITIEHTYPTVQITLIVHHCQHLSGIPQPIESEQIRWVKPSDLHLYKFPAANSAIITAIEHWSTSG